MRAARALQPRQGMSLRWLVVPSFAAATLLATVVAPRTAGADDAPALAEPPGPDPAGYGAPGSSPSPAAYAAPVVDGGAPVERVWYGHELMVVDAVGGLMAYGAVHLDQPSEILGWGFAGTYLFGGPLVHAANGEGLRALGSFGLRAGLPVAGTLIGAALDSGHHCRGDVCFENVDGMYWGGIIGMVSAVLVDDLLLAHKVVRHEPTWAPTVSRSPGGALTFGAAGTF